MDPRGNSVTSWFMAALLSAFLCADGRCEEPGKTQALWIQRAGGRQLSFPVDIAVDRRGVAFLLDSGSRSIGLFTPKGDFLREIPGRGVFRDPMAIALGPDGVIFVADGDSGRVLEIELSGKVRREYTAGKNARITGVGIFGDTVYCVDNRNDKIVIFRRGGGTLQSWGGKGDRAGEFQAPFRLAVDAAGRVFVSDVLNARVQWFSAFGQHLGTLRRFGAGEGKILRPTGISLDSRGRLWIGDSYSGLVQLFEENGSLVRALALSGRPHVFGDPVGVAVTADGLWVVDQKDGKAVLVRR